MIVINSAINCINCIFLFTLNCSFAENEKLLSYVMTASTIKIQRLRHFLFSFLIAIPSGTSTAYFKTMNLFLTTISFSKIYYQNNIFNFLRLSNKYIRPPDPPFTCRYVEADMTK